MEQVRQKSALFLTICLGVSGVMLAWAAAASLSRSGIVDFGPVLLAAGAVVQLVMSYLTSLKALNGRETNRNPDSRYLSGRRITDRPLAPMTRSDIVFVARKVSIEVVWQKGRREVPIGPIEYDLQDETDFLDLDRLLEDLVAPNAREVSGMERANDALAAQVSQAAEAAQGEQEPPPAPQAAPSDRTARENLPAKQVPRGK